MESERREVVMERVSERDTEKGNEIEYVERGRGDGQNGNKKEIV